MINIETFMYILFVLYILGGMCNIYLGIVKEKIKTEHDTNSIISGFIMLIGAIVCLMW